MQHRSVSEIQVQGMVYDKGASQIIFRGSCSMQIHHLGNSLDLALEFLWRILLLIYGQFNFWLLIIDLYFLSFVNKHFNILIPHFGSLSHPPLHPLKNPQSHCTNVISGEMRKGLFSNTLKHSSHLLCSGNPKTLLSG